MAVVINEFELVPAQDEQAQPAAPAPPPPQPAQTPQSRAHETRRQLRLEHERHLRVRAH
jgi:hypothetical protein